jgi:xanthine/CO dehydrogenase XdhC/CoxF family maturation factor
MIETTTNVKRQIAALERMTVSRLQQRYAEVFGETARSGNRQWLLRRVAWRIQSLAEGDLATRAIERCRERARELARDADLRLRPPDSPNTDTGQNGAVAVGAMPVRRDERIPPPGAVLTRLFKGYEYKVTVLPDGFEYDGDVYRSLSAVAHAITGSHWNGLHFFGLAERKARKEGRP